MKSDHLVSSNILFAAEVMATYGVPRITAIVNRTRRSEDLDRKSNSL